MKGVVTLVNLKVENVVDDSLLHSLQNIDEEVFGIASSKDYYESTYTQFILAYINNQLIGYVGLSKCPNEIDTLLISSVAITETHRNHGIGSTLLTNVVASVGYNRLKVKAANPFLVRICNKLGFTLEGSMTEYIFVKEVQYG